MSAKLTGYRDARCQSRDDHGVRCGKNAGHLGEHWAHENKPGLGLVRVTWK